MGAVMGYFTRMDLIEVAINPRYVRLVEDAIQGKKQKTKEFQYILKSLELDPEGYLQWNWRKDPYGPEGKFYACEEMVLWLRAYCAGGIIAFWSQEGDGCAWVYEFDGEGGVSNCRPRRAAAIKGWAARKNPKREAARRDRMMKYRWTGFNQL